jgi:hypothetical protein
MQVCKVACKNSVECPFPAKEPGKVRSVLVK